MHNFRCQYHRISAPGTCCADQDSRQSGPLPDSRFCSPDVQTERIGCVYGLPSRERAGWLCDSFFTARVEYVLTGTCTVEKVFLENFLLADQFEHLPEGMLPMCYPADHYDGVFIPNWAMWFVLELEEYLVRSGDTELIIRAKKRVFDLLRYLETFENADGLLERLPSWVFVEWSAANDWVQDVNFPSNMLYARMLQAVARLYQEPGLLKKAAVSGKLSASVLITAISSRIMK